MSGGGFGDQQEDSMLTFKEYYKQKMDKLINIVLDKLEDA